MNNWKITSLSEREDKLSQMESWALMADDIEDTFKKWELIWKKFLDSVSDLIKILKDENVMKLVKWYYKNYWGWLSWKETFKKLVDLWYLDISKWKDYSYFIEPQLIESAMFYMNEYPDKAVVIKEIFHIE